MRCSCPKPGISSNPRHPATHCSKCGHEIGDDVLSTDETVAEYFDQLEEGMFALKAPASKRLFFRRVIALCRGREREGRGKFGVDYLSHDGYRNISEEVADALVYSHLRRLRARRDRGTDENTHLLLGANQRFIEGLEMVAEYESKQRGSP